MASYSKPTKAQISYKIGTGEDAIDQVIRFHGVKAEEHEASSDITGFPVQDGFIISNHAIKKNRKVSITGYVTNHLVIGAEEFHEYGSNNVRVMFSTLQQLVNKAIPCDVATNFGNYTPVIFNRFRTKLVAGKTDMMEFTMMGQEVQVGTTVNGNEPTLLVFKILSDEERAARVDELLAAGLVVPEEAIVSEAPVDLNESFQVETTDTNGQTSTTTYEKTSYDPTTNTHGHTVHTSATAVATATTASTYLNWVQIVEEENAMDIMSMSTSGEGAETQLLEDTLPSVDFVAGANTASACLKDGLIGIINDTVEDTIDTAIGILSDSLYGAVVDIMKLGGDSALGQALIALGVECLVAGAVGSVNDDISSDDFQDNTLSTPEDVLNGAKETGNQEATRVLGKAAPTTITKITPPTGGAVPFFGDTI